MSRPGSPPADVTSPEPTSGWPPQGAATRATPLRELGALAAWSVTSAKPGNGVELLRDGSTDTYWQSDGVQPHLVNIQFNRRVAVQEVHLFLDFRADESYTPSRLSVRAGSAYHDLKDVCIVEMKEPSGWVVIPLTGHTAGQPRTQDQVHAFFFQVAVLANHQNGRDTHIRQVLLFGPSTQASPSNQGALTTLDATTFSTLR